tara:strand:+ start:992 stop:2173 length:1182 start_codon:yes stop_codon:yes gene_type:complete
MAIDYTDIDEVVNDFQLMMDDTSYDKDAQIYQLRLLALQGLRELKFDAEQEVKTTTMTVDSTTLQVTLPTDYVKLLRIGYRSSDDEIIPLGYKSNLALDATVTAEVSDNNFDENNPYYHTDIGKKFGVGGGQNTLGYYRVNRNDNTINFSSDVSGKTVFMEYISDGLGEEQAKDYVIRLTFQDGSGIGDGTINTSSSFKIPDSSISNSVSTFNFTSNISNADIQTIVVNVNDGLLAVTNTGEEIAEKFSTLINNGYPNDNVPPTVFKGIKASQNGNKVTLTYSKDIDFKSINSSSYDSNSEGSNKVLSTRFELLQLGTSGSKPRVHKFCEEALRSYIYYKYIQRKRGVPANEKQMAKRSFYNEKRLARARMMSFNKEAAMQVSRKAFKQSPKI